MSFYEEIADYYDFIFPFNRAQIDFTKSCIGGADRAKKVLDVGCGTGDLAGALSDIGFEVSGIDADAAMIDKARLKHSSPSPRPSSLKGEGDKDKAVTFLTMDMREIVRSFKPSHFDAVLCFGNTLVHLNNLAEIESFCADVKTVLKDGGKFLLQILNYDHILDDNVSTLPLIENNILVFERSYEYNHIDNLISFKTVLTIKDGNKKMENEIPLYPLRKQELDAALKKAGFVNISYYGDFDKRALEKNSLPLVVEAS